jgi:hypothetical protein
MGEPLRENYLADGRDLDWRLAWEERLSPRARREVEQAVKEGRVVEKTRLRMFAVGLARRHMRPARWYLLLIPLHFAHCRPVDLRDLLSGFVGGRMVLVLHNPGGGLVSRDSASRGSQVAQFPVRVQWRCRQ